MRLPYFYKVTRWNGDHWTTVWAGTSYLKALDQILVGPCRITLTRIGVEPEGRSIPLDTECPF